LLAKLALENIVINALKYAGADKPVQIRLAVDRNGHAEFTVEDQGPGLEPEQYAQIGQTVQLRKPNQDKPGFGLGLSLVAHIARAHGGSFSASPGQTQGVCWVLKLGQS
jgi:signal transduction histidine kinase